MEITHEKEADPKITGLAVGALIGTAFGVMGVAVGAFLGFVLGKGIEKI